MLFWEPERPSRSVTSFVQRTEKHRASGAIEHRNRRRLHHNDQKAEKCGHRCSQICVRIEIPCSKRFTLESERLLNLQDCSINFGGWGPEKMCQISQHQQEDKSQSRCFAKR